MIITKLRTFLPPRQTTGLSVVSHTLCKMEVFPAFARPIMRTRNLIFGRGRWGLVVPIGVTEFGRQESLIEVISSGWTLVFESRRLRLGSSFPMFLVIEARDLIDLIPQFSFFGEVFYRFHADSIFSLSAAEQKLSSAVIDSANFAPESRQALIFG